MMHLLLVHLLLLFHRWIGLRLGNLRPFPDLRLLILIYFDASRLLLLLHFFFFFVFEHALDLSLLRLRILRFLFFIRIEFPFDFLMEFLQFLVDFSGHEHATLSEGSLCVFPDLV